jgi:hypothetical protein
MAAKTTIVTMYFNIKNLPDATESVRPKSFYMEKGRPTLTLNYPMIIFCDDTCYEDIKAIRGDRPTHYIVKSLLDYDFYRDNFPIVRKNREGNPKYVGNRVTASYCILTVMKLYSIYMAKQVSPFESTHYAWVDFGGSHILRNFEEYAPKMLDAPHPKISFCYIHFRGADELTMTSEFSNGGYTSIGATCFTVESSYVERFYTGCMSVFYEMLAVRLCHHEEQVLAYFYHRYPHLCSLYYGDYASSLTNYHVVREDYYSIKRYFINEALNKGYSHLAAKCAKDILGSAAAGTIVLPPEEKQFLLVITA